MSENTSTRDNTAPMIRLSGIGKIYVSAGNVSVGIRGVNLSFDKGEFVAVTGKSGSGKSTLLNVISGMDSYEEGELFINGQPTSHYQQKDWEEYRKEYIAFIFQDYNIIESFTVLQNVELALMNIPDLRTRRKRAVELIKRVGLEKFMNHKGSKLSGGQKQRTVIARALAKDSPVILADEPTGNLDSATSEEIVSLLGEIAKDKLVIVVTHNYEQFETVATRHIRVFDGFVESDKPTGIPCRLSDAAENTGAVEEEPKKESEKVSNAKNGLQLGAAIFASKPKLTIFLCLLLFIGTLGIFLVTSVCKAGAEMFEQRKMFNYSEGRVVLTRIDGAPMTDDELKQLVSSTDAVSFLHYDLLLDKYFRPCVEEIGYNAPVDRYPDLRTEKVGASSTASFGRLPEKANEVYLKLPIGYKPYFGTSELKIKTLDLGGYPEYKLVITGIEYFADNNKDAVMLLTEEGYQYASILYFTKETSKLSISDCLKENADPEKNSFFEAVDISAAHKALSGSYKQASLFFKNDKDAGGSISALRDKGYIAVRSDATYQPSGLDLIEGVISSFFLLLLWVAAIFFLAFFIHLCTSKSVASFKPDMAIMRSMGIPTTVIKSGIFVRMLLSLIPGFVAVILIAIAIFTIPAANAFFSYLYGWQYVMIFAGTLLVVLLVTRKQIKKLFSESVKKTIRGGGEA